MLHINDAEFWKTRTLNINFKWGPLGKIKLQVKSGSQANTDPEFSPRSSDRRTDGGQADFSDEGVDAYRGWCTFQSVHFDGSMFAGHYAAGDQQLSSWWQIKTQRILLSTGMRLTHDRAVFRPRMSVRVYSDRIRRLQVGVTGLKIQSCHRTGDSAIYCKTVVYDTSSTEENNLSQTGKIISLKSRNQSYVVFIIYCIVKSLRVVRTAEIRVCTKVHRV